MTRAPEKARTENINITSEAWSEKSACEGGVSEANGAFAGG